MIGQYGSIFLDGSSGYHALNFLKLIDSISLVLSSLKVYLVWKASPCLITMDLSHSILMVYGPSNKLAPPSAIELI